MLCCEVDGKEGDEPVPTHSHPLRPKAANHRSTKKSRVVDQLPHDGSIIENLNLGQASRQSTLCADDIHHSGFLVCHPCVRRGYRSERALVGGAIARCDDATLRGRAAEFDPPLILPPHKATVQRFNLVS